MFYRRIIESTKLEKMAPLFIGTNLLITSPEPRPVELMKVLKKFPEMIVLGKYHNRIPSHGGRWKLGAPSKLGP